MFGDLSGLFILSGLRKNKPPQEPVNKNCPFCGSTPVRHSIISCGDECQVRCFECGGRGPVAVSAAEAVTLWRKRS